MSARNCTSLLKAPVSARKLDFPSAHTAIGNDNMDMTHFLVNVGDRLAGLVVKASSSGAENPGFESHLRPDFSGFESHQSLKN